MLGKESSNGNLKGVTKRGKRVYSRATFACVQSVCEFMQFRK